jgi:hypothetical protein
VCGSAISAQDFMAAADFMADRDDPVFIVGCGRSGTTLLRLMLSSPGSLVIPPESDFLWRAAARFGPDSRLDQAAIAEFVEFVRRISSFSGLQLDAAELLDGLTARPAPVPIADCIAQVYAAYAAKRGCTRWGDKNPFYVLRLDLIQKLFPGARIIHVLRDGRDVAVSYQKTRMRPYNVYMTALRWTRCVTAGQRWGAKNPAQYLEVRYEDLIGSTERELRRVCEFIGEEFSPAMLTFYEQNEDLQQIPPSDRAHHQNLAKPLMRDNRAKWRREMDPTQRYVFEATAGPLLARLGYPLTPSSSSALLDGYLAMCRARHTLGRTRPVRKVAAAPYWKARRLVRNLFLIDNEHYRDQVD